MDWVLFVPGKRTRQKKRILLMRNQRDFKLFYFEIKFVDKM